MAERPPPADLDVRLRWPGAPSEGAPEASRGSVGDPTAAETPAREGGIRVHTARGGPIAELRAEVSALREEVRALRAELDAQREQQAGD